MDYRELAAAERADLADFLGTLSAQQWDAPTLCDSWSVRQVVAHVISYDHLDVGALAARMARAGFNPNRANAIGVTELAGRSPAELLALLRANGVPRGLPARFGGRIGLVDGMIHHQDIRRGLGVPREIPVERLRVALPFARTAPPIRAFVRARGLRLVATDVDWTSGRGPEVRGPGEAVLLAMAGRGAAVPELDGPGTATLAARIG